LGEILSRSGRRDEASSVLEQAARRFELKGNTVSLERVRALVPNTRAGT
jgi:hypothetical protein